MDATGASSFWIRVDPPGGDRDRLAGPGRHQGRHRAGCASSTTARSRWCWNAAFPSSSATGSSPPSNWPIRSWPSVRLLAGDGREDDPRSGRAAQKTAGRRRVQLAPAMSGCGYVVASTLGVCSSCSLFRASSRSRPCTWPGLEGRPSGQKPPTTAKEERLEPPEASPSKEETEWLAPYSFCWKFYDVASIWTERNVLMQNPIGRAMRIWRWPFSTVAGQPE